MDGKIEITNLLMHALTIWGLAFPEDALFRRFTIC